MGEHKHKTGDKGDGYRAAQAIRYAPELLVKSADIKPGGFRRLPASATKRQYALGKRLAKRLPTRKRAEAAR